ncbi:hypothetical protein BLA60_40295 [Actinophytocola xinjiangensis]|uniref:Excreted virulence factor EspC (Type VII ESX diderm) n=1 Tax=Actinophytocola xinjiangensis TaxID=485602 RepID=A0A7Z1AU19_9PSEU|nr:hypothetical protein [Actinophytocola xinjiangensis]OLF04534.1 hypothetical protein BLA60_40295 [Actinophytocola xinjiangensis]
MARTIGDVANVWSDLRISMKQWSMDSFTLGALGEAEGYPGDYNEVLTEIVTKVGAVMESFVSADLVLREVAATYEAQEAEYYEKFGYVEEELED